MSSEADAAVDGSVSPAVVERVRARLAAPGRRIVGSIDDAVRAEVGVLADDQTLAAFDEELLAQLAGAGVLERLLARDGVTDVLVNGPDQVWIDGGAGLARTAVRFGSTAEVRALAVRLAAQAGRRLDDANPFVDAVLPDGTRMHAVLPPLVASPTISLRVLARRRLSLADLVAAAACDQPTAELLRTVVAARLTMLISGGTGSGKTTLLAALLATVAPDQRIITVEDAAELTVDHPHVVGLVTRTPNAEQAGAVSMATLVRQALRMRCDRLVVGEFRGAEVVELLTALNTGHAGGAATVHANSAEDVPSRLVALAALGGMGPDVLMAQAASALDVLVHVARDRAGVRQVEQVAMWPSEQSRAPSLVWSRSAGPGAAAGMLAARLERLGVGVPALLGGAR